MKSIIILTVLLLTITSGYSQKVISANGNTATTAGVQVSWTIGEPLTATVTDGATILTQGFQQSKLTATVINDIEVQGVDIKVYPNPTSDYVTVHFSELTENTGYYLFDLSGRVLIQKKIESTDTKIDMTAFAGGSYILKLLNGQQPLQTFKVVKR